MTITYRGQTYTVETADELITLVSVLNRRVA